MQHGEKNNMKWKAEVPNQEGLYLYKSNAEWVIRATRVKMGQWEHRQNPQALYAGSELLRNLYYSLWYGPLPEPIQEQHGEAQQSSETEAQQLTSEIEKLTAIMIESQENFNQMAKRLREKTERLREIL